MLRCGESFSLLEDTLDWLLKLCIVAEILHCGCDGWHHRMPSVYSVLLIFVLQQAFYFSFFGVSACLSKDHSLNSFHSAVFIAALDRSAYRFVQRCYAILVLIVMVACYLKARLNA